MEEPSERLLLSDEHGKEEEEGLRQRIWKENKKLWIVAAPAIFTRFSTFGISLITQAFIGHVGDVELAAYALVFTVLTRFANGILVVLLSSAPDPRIKNDFVNSANQLHNSHADHMRTFA